jgi:hypothetical protein
MMAQAIDCATPLTYTKAKQFVSQGILVFGRYLADDDSWKRLSYQEAQAITDAGGWIVSGFERWPERAAEGAEAGRVDGMLALQYAQEVGQPEGTTIYPAVDFDENPSHYDAVEAYLRAFDAEITGYECGVYGEEEVCRVMRERGVVTKVWQTYAWSGGKKVDNPNFFQYDNGPTGNGQTVNGINVDLDVSNGNAGGWQVGMAIIQQPQLSAEDADFAIGLFQEAHKMGVTKITKPSGEVAAVDEDKIHELANAQRRASGQPEE